MEASKMYDLISEVKRDNILNMLKTGRRIDGRGFDDYRPIKVEVGVSEKAEGSALVQIGSTRVMAGVKLALGEPFADMPNSGVLTTNAELIPLASPTFEKGPPDEDTIELARVVDRGIRESKCIDLEKLCRVEGEEVWIVFIDLHILDYDGNLFDASELAAVAALVNTRIPKVEDGRVLYKEKTDEKLPIVDLPVETTFAKIGDAIVVDPILDEEQTMDARLTIAYTKKGDICAMQKGGDGTFTQDEIFEIVDRGRKRAEELRKYISEKV
jgi:exosome complex component RRP42